MGAIGTHGPHPTHTARTRTHARTHRQQNEYTPTQQKQHTHPLCTRVCWQQCKGLPRTDNHAPGKSLRWLDLYCYVLPDSIIYIYIYIYMYNHEATQNKNDDASGSGLVSAHCSTTAWQAVPCAHADFARRLAGRFVVGAPRRGAHVAFAVWFTSGALLVTLGLRVCVITGGYTCHAHSTGTHAHTQREGKDHGCVQLLWRAHTQQTRVVWIPRCHHSSASQTYVVDATGVHADARGRGGAWQEGGHA